MKDPCSVGDGARVPDATDMYVVIHALHPVGYTVHQVVCTAPGEPDFDAITGQFLPVWSKP